MRHVVSYFDITFHICIYLFKYFTHTIYTKAFCLKVCIFLRKIPLNLEQCILVETQSEIWSSARRILDDIELVKMGKNGEYVREEEKAYFDVDIDFRLVNQA